MTKGERKIPMKNKTIILFVIAILLIAFLIVGAYIYVTTGVYHPITTTGLILLIIVVGMLAKVKKK